MKHLPIYVSPHAIMRLRERVPALERFDDVRAGKVAHAMFRTAIPYGGQIGGDWSVLATHAGSGAQVVMIATMRPPHPNSPAGSIRIRTVLTEDQFKANQQAFLKGMCRGDGGGAGGGRGVRGFLGGEKKRRRRIKRARDRREKLNRGTPAPPPPGGRREEAA